MMTMLPEILFLWAKVALKLLADKSVYAASEKSGRNYCNE